MSRGMAYSRYMDDRVLWLLPTALLWYHTPIYKSSVFNKFFEIFWKNFFEHYNTTKCAETGAQILYIIKEKRQWTRYVFLRLGFFGTPLPSASRAHPLHRRWLFIFHCPNDKRPDRTGRSLFYYIYCYYAVNWAYACAEPTVMLPAVVNPIPWKLGTV